MRALLSVLGVAGWALVLGQFAFGDEPVYRIDGGDVTEPQAAEKAEPGRTEDARQARFQGTVILQLEVNEEGRAENIHVVRGLSPALNEQAIATVQQRKFATPKVNGKPVRSTATFEVTFRLPPTPASDPTYQVGPDVSAPRVLKKVDPKYTEETRKAGVRGTVILRFAINREGRPEDIVVVQSLDPDLDQNAIAALQQWEFEPGKKNGQPVRVSMTVEMNFAWRQ
jgi:TonB family protein